MADDAGDRTEQPTPRRRQEAREQGRVARSADLSTAATLLGGLALLNWLGHDLFEGMLQFMGELGRIDDPAGVSPGTALGRAAHMGAKLVLPFLGLLMVVTAAAAMLQSGFLLAWKQLTPDVSRLSLLKGARRLFSLQSWTKLIFGLLKLGLLGFTAYLTLRGQVDRLVSTSGLAPGGILLTGVELTYTLAVRLGLLLLLLALIDYAYQRWEFERSLKMTKQEVRDELRKMEGDPTVKHRQRQLQMRLAMQRIGLDVPKADVVVTNPTHFAVALKYDEGTMSAPRVTAKGKELLAQRIRQVAEEAGVPIVERPPLARGLYAAVEVGQEVPQAYYKAVAEVLAYVYQLSGRASAARA